MGFIFHGRYFNIITNLLRVAHLLQVEHHTFATIPVFYDIDDRLDKSSQGFLLFFYLMPAQKCLYAQLKLDGEAYSDWNLLQCLLHHQ